jgi:hypothetical protein
LVYLQIDVSTNRRYTNKDRNGMMDVTLYVHVKTPAEGYTDVTTDVPNISIFHLNAATNKIQRTAVVTLPNVTLIQHWPLHQQQYQLLHLQPDRHRNQTVRFKTINNKVWWKLSFLHWSWMMLVVNRIGAS